MPSYHRVRDNEWVQPIRRGYKMMCCDCGLVHTLNFRLVKYGGGKTKIQFQADRNERATALSRRAEKRCVLTVKK
jgi:hypothetical protein